jgi:aldehyde dehydrogenase (NAD+)
MEAWQGKLDRLFIGGEWVKPAAGDRLEVISPFTEEVVAAVPSATKADVDAAVAAARQAFDDGEWSRTTLPDRMAMLARLRDLLVEDQGLMADLITEEMGCPVTQSRAIQAVNPIRVLDAYLDCAPDYPFSTVRRSEFGNALVTREPVGVVAAVVPWNVPLSITVQKLAPALLAGCTMVVKPSPETPLDAYRLAELVVKAGIPGGVVNVVPADREVSEYLVSHPGVDKVAFTGSTAAGRRIASLCGQDLRKVTLELGGKSAAVILEDADLEVAVEALRLGAFRNNGQVCSLKTRIVVPRHREGELLERMVALVQSMPVGDPSDPGTQIGPLVSSRQRGIVENYIEIGRAEGAQVVVGGWRPKEFEQGWFVEPTVFSGVEPDMRIAQEEIFGPVVCVLPYDLVEEAIGIANNSAYGLNGSVFTSDLDKGLEVARRMHTGTVELNGSPTGFQAPFGGVKASGIGRENGPEGFDAYVELKSIGLPAEAVGRAG